MNQKGAARVSEINLDSASRIFRISHRALPGPRHRVHRGRDKLVQLSVHSVSELCVLCGKKLIDKVYEGVPKVVVSLHTTLYLFV